MFFKDKIWDETKSQNQKASIFASELKVSPLITGILLGRGFDTVDKMRDFLFGKKNPFYDPLSLKDMEKACFRIEDALARREKIVIYGDYDVDGVSATSILYLYFKERGAVVDFYIPKRENEGYGLHDEALKIIAGQGTKLLITVDCGISAVSEIANKPLGMDIIITDHHAVSNILPPAYAIINPHRLDCSYPFKDLSGVGVAFKLCQALEKRQGREWCKYTELVTLGTVADVVPLLDENREIVRRGLVAMDNTSLIGLKTLIKQSLGNNKKVTAESISFGLAPRLNAVGRLEHAKSAVELLTTTDSNLAEAISNKLEEQNRERQKISQDILNDAEAMLAYEEHLDTAIILSNNWHPGVVGIVASRLVEKYFLPTLLFSVNDGIAKGSCRSIPSLNIHDAIAQEKDILEQFGGHHQAAGLTVKIENFNEFKKRFTKYVRNVVPKDGFYPHLKIDFVLDDFQTIDLQDVKDLELLEPCGAENQQPVFAYHNARIEKHQVIGDNQNHLRFTVCKGDEEYSAVMWNRADLITSLESHGVVLDIAFQPRINEFRGNVSVQLNVLDLHQPMTVYDFRGCRDDKFFTLSQMLKTVNELNILVNGNLNENSELFRKKIGNNFQFIKLHNYFDFIPKSDSNVICFDLPQVHLLSLITECRKAGVRNFVLLYQGDLELHKWCISHPDRESMVKAYMYIKKYMTENNELDYKKIVKKNSFLSEEMFLIFAEIGLIILDGTIIKEMKNTKTELEMSALYCMLFGERKKFEEIYSESVALTRSEIVRR